MVAAVAVGARGSRSAAPRTSPSSCKTIPITKQPGKQRRVVLSLGVDTDSDSPLPELAADDRLLALAELELTTDAEDPTTRAHRQRVLVRAQGRGDDVAGPRRRAGGGEGSRAVEIVKQPWREAISHQRHHAVITFGDGELRIPAGGPPWRGPSRVNVVVSASHPDAKPGNVLLVGQNEKTPTVVQDMAGIRVVRYRPGSEKGPQAEVERPACAAASRSPSARPWCCRTSSPGSPRANGYWSRRGWSPMPPGSPPPRGSPPGCSWPTVPTRSSRAGTPSPR